MRKLFLLLSFIALYGGAKAQKIEGIYFNLYTDSLKKGFYNYINVDGEFSDGSWLPLDSSHLTFWCNTGYFKGNDLFIDSLYTGDSVVVKVALKKQPSLAKQTIIYIRKRGFDEPLYSERDIIYDGRKKRSN